MATSGSFATNIIGNSFYFTFAWSRTGYDSSRNEHYIYYEVVAHNTPGSYRTVYLKNLWIAGSQMYYEAGTSGNGRKYYNGDVVTSGNITIASSNSAGDGSFGASFEAGVGIYPGSNCSNETSWDLDRIPRYANFTEHYVSSTTINSITVRWNADAVCDAVQYSLNGSSWYSTSGLTYTLTGLNPNTQYNIRTRIKRSDSQLWTESGYIYGTTKDYARVTGANNFNSNVNPYMTFTNASGLTCNLRLEFGGTSISRNGYTGSGGGYTFTLTQAERNLLYSKCANSKTLTVRYVVATILNGSETWWSFLDKTMTVVSSEPTFSDYTYEDVGVDSTALTGNSQIVIKDYNTIQITIPVANKATANNSATMATYKAICGDKSDEKAYSSNEDVVLSLSNISDSTISVYAIDSRGFSTKVDKTISNWKAYSAPVIRTASLSRQNNVGKQTTLVFSGDFWTTSNQYDFGAEENEITECKYRYKKTNEVNYGNWIDITPTVSGSNFSFNSIIAGDEGATGFGLLYSYNIQISLKDQIKTATYELILGVGTPPMSVAPGGVSFGAPYNNSVGGALQECEQRLQCSDCVQMYAGSQQYITVSAAWTSYKIPLTSARTLGTALSFDSTNKRIVANKAGYVDFFGQLDIYTVGYVNGDFSLKLFKNGSAYQNFSYEYISTSKSYDKIFGFINNVQVDEGDYFELYVNCGNTGTIRTFDGTLTSLSANFRRLL